MTAILSRMVREEYSAKVIYESKPERAGGNLPWDYFKEMMIPGQEITMWRSWSGRMSSKFKAL